jgi:hypothetical protein
MIPEVHHGFTFGGFTERNVSRGTGMLLDHTDGPNSLESLGIPPEAGSVVESDRTIDPEDVVKFSSTL